MKAILFLLWIPLQVHSQVQGKAELEHYTFNPDMPNKGLKINIRIWYQGSQSIQEVPFIDSRQNSTGAHTMVYVKYYLFIDTTQNQFFYYDSFSDTSKLIINFKGGNPFEKYGGWNLHSNKKFDYDDSKKITDTNINGSNYNRYRFRKIKDGKINDFILYALLKKRDVPVKYLKPFAEEIGCTVFRMDTYYEGRLTGIHQIKYLSDTLTDEEKRVFKAWPGKLKKTSK